MVMLSISKGKYKDAELKTSFLTFVGFVDSSFGISRVNLTWNNRAISQTMHCFSTVSLPFPELFPPESNKQRCRSMKKN